MEKVETLEHAGRTITIYVDPDPIDPVKEYEELTAMACWHRQARLGHQQIDGGTSEEEMRAEAEEKGDPILAILPLYIYDHSGMTIATSPFSCRFDSGQVGWAYVTKSSAEKMGCTGTYYRREDEKDDKGGTVYTPDGEWTTERYEESIRGDVKSYDYYLTGECYGFVITGIDGDEIDSCWGFLGDSKYCVEEAKSAAEGTADPGVERRAVELASRATYAGPSPDIEVGVTP